MADLTLSWNDLRERARNHKELSVEAKEAAVSAFDILEGIFGSSFLNEQQHPLFRFFFDRSAWRCDWATWFAAFLKSIELHPDFHCLVQGLKNASLYYERMTILKVVETLIGGGFSFRLDSLITINGGLKKPDLFVQLDASDPGFYIEVSVFGPSQKQRDADKVFHELWGRFWFPSLEFSGQIQQILAPLHLQEIKQKIYEIANKARSETGFETLNIPGTIQFGCAVPSHMNKLEDWAAMHGMKVGQLSGPPANVEEFDRIAFKLEKEIKQLPTDRANVVVLYSHLFALPPSDTAEFANFVHSLEGIVYKHANVGYLAFIFSWTGDNKGSVFRYRDHMCVNRCRLYFNSDSVMLIKNRFAAKPMAPAVEERFLEAFAQTSGGYSDFLG